MARYPVRMPRGWDQEEQEIVHYTLDKICPPGCIIAFNTSLGILTYLGMQDDSVVILREIIFTTSEICVLLPLLEAYPQFCPYEVVLASFNTGRVDKSAIAKSRKKLQEAQEAGLWDQEMRPVRNVLSRVRIKMRDIGVGVSSILVKGYWLCPPPIHAHLTRREERW